MVTIWEIFLSSVRNRKIVVGRKENIIWKDSESIFTEKLRSVPFIIAL